MIDTPWRCCRLWSSRCSSLTRRVAGFDTSSASLAALVALSAPTSASLFCCCAVDSSAVAAMRVRCRCSSSLLKSAWARCKQCRTECRVRRIKVSVMVSSMHAWCRCSCSCCSRSAPSGVSSNIVGDHIPASVASWDPCLGCHCLSGEDAKPATCCAMPRRLAGGIKDRRFLSRRSTGLDCVATFCRSLL